eukprot:350727-Chlamydomonas_euryale.AAC.1
MPCHAMPWSANAAEEIVHGPPKPRACKRCMTVFFPACAAHTLSSVRRGLGVWPAAIGAAAAPMAVRAIVHRMPPPHEPACLPRRHH